MLEIKPIPDWEIPGIPKEQLFLALAEGATVLAVGKVPDNGHLVDATGIYQLADDGVNYRGWTFISNHSNSEISGLTHYEKVHANLLQICPVTVEYVSYVEPDLALRDSSKTVQELLVFLFGIAMPKDKKQLN